MARPIYSKFFWKDWEAKTQDLDPYEFTAYMRLLAYAKLYSPDYCSIPGDDERLARIVRFGLKRWRSVRERVLEYWFLRVDQKYEHQRLREEADAWAQLSIDQRNRRTGGQPERDRAITNSEVRSQKESKESKHLSAGADVTLIRVIRQTDLAARQSHPTFGTWWAIYPRKVGPKLAFKAYCKALLEAPAGKLYDAAVQYAKSMEGKEIQYVAHPATWLNQGRWADEIAKGGEVDSAAEVRARAIREEIRKLEAGNGSL